MTTARVRPLPEHDLVEWRAARAAAGVPLPEPSADGVHEALTVEVDGVDVGGALLAYAPEPGGVRCAVRVLQTTLPHASIGAWVAVASTLAEHARDRGAVTLTSAVAPTLTDAFGQAGFQATVITASEPFDVADPTLQEGVDVVHVRKDLR